MPTPPIAFWICRSKVVREAGAHRRYLGAVSPGVATTIMPVAADMIRLEGVRACSASMITLVGTTYRRSPHRRCTRRAARVARLPGPPVRLQVTYGAIEGPANTFTNSTKRASTASRRRPPDHRRPLLRWRRGCGPARAAPDSSQSEWIKMFDPRDWTVFVPQIATRREQGATVRIDLDVGGWLVTLRGTVVGHRDEPTGVVVALGGDGARQDQLPERLRPRRPPQPAREAPAADPAASDLRRRRGPGEHVHQGHQRGGRVPVHGQAAARDLAGPHARRGARASRSRCRWSARSRTRSSRRTTSRRAWASCSSSTTRSARQLMVGDPRARGACSRSGPTADEYASSMIA